MGRRAVAVQETRDAVLDAVYELLRAPEAGSVSVEDIARRAGVARATVYYQFGSRVGLFREVNAYLGERGNLDALREVRRQSDPLASVRGYIPAVVEFWAADHEVYRNLFAIAAVDTDVREATEATDEQRRDVIRWLVRRLRDAGELADGIGEQYATDLIWFATGFTAYDQLCRRSGMTAAAASAALLAMVGHLFQDEPR